MHFSCPRAEIRDFACYAQFVKCGLNGGASICRLSSISLTPGINVEISRMPQRGILSQLPSQCIIYVFLRRCWLATPAQTKQLVRGSDVFSHKNILAISSSSRSAFSSFEPVIHQSRLLTLAQIPRKFFVYDTPFHA